MHDTIWGLFCDDILIRHLSSARATVDAQWNSYLAMMREMWQRSGLIDAEQTTLEFMGAAFGRYNREVQEVVPAERLLVWTPSDGWDPLCEFLELPVPELPFPRVNDSGEFAERIIDASLRAIEQHRELNSAEPLLAVALE